MYKDELYMEKYCCIFQKKIEHFTTKKIILFNKY